MSSAPSLGKLVTISRNAERKKLQKEANLAADQTSKNGNFASLSADVGSLTQCKRIWLVDSRVTSYIYCNKLAFITYCEILQYIVKGLEGADVPAVGKGSISVLFNVDGKEVPVILQNVLHVSTSSYNLISLLALLM